MSKSNTKTTRGGKNLAKNELPLDWNGKVSESNTKEKIDWVTKTVKQINNLKNWGNAKWMTEASFVQFNVTWIVQEA